jgi:SHS2 domain-containing protein
MNYIHSSYQIIDHTADLGIIVEGTNEKNLFIRAAQAMTDLMVQGDISKRTVSKDVSLQGEDFSDLMVRWLGEILYLFEGEHLIVNSIKMKTLTPVHVRSKLELTDFDPEKHEIIREIKAVTYHQISVEKKDGWWEARIIFDI